ncbi:MAG: hypothetical protein MMC23_004402 [Stictis urceolatum]|nr:hypothetical protein [Stictis urceolata]
MGVIAFENSQPAVLEYCFSQGLMIDNEDVDEQIVWLAETIPIFKVLLEHGWKVNQFLEYFGDTLVLACRDGDLARVNFLLENEADVTSDFGDSCFTNMMYAIAGTNASPDIVRLLLEYGYQPQGKGMLIAAAENGNLHATEILLETGKVDIEEVKLWRGSGSRPLDDMDTALYSAAANGHVEMCELLLQYGARWDFKERDGTSRSEMGLQRSESPLDAGYCGVELDM